jgi:hypothetical protein
MKSIASIGELAMTDAIIKCDGCGKVECIDYRSVGGKP